MQSARHTSRGFTLMEILITLVVFSISLIGLVAMQSRAIEAEKGANHIRHAQRIAEETMAELMSRGFNDMVMFDFEGQGPPDPLVAYDDLNLAGPQLTRDFRRPPVDAPDTTNVAGSVRDTYVVFRQVTFDCDINPTNPCVAGLPSSVQGLNLAVMVLWLDDTNPSFPPPEILPGGAQALAQNIRPWMIDPADPDFEPSVARVELYTYRANDGPGAPPPGGGGTGGGTGP